MTFEGSVLCRPMVPFLFGLHCLANGELNMTTKTKTMCMESPGTMPNAGQHSVNVLPFFLLCVSNVFKETS